MRYLEMLGRGTFCAVWCGSCRDTVWPPSPYCSACLGETTVVPYNGRGTLVEFSVRDGTAFGVCRFGKMHIMGEVSSRPCRPGMAVVVSRCGVDGTGPFYVFAAADDP